MKTIMRVIGFAASVAVVSFIAYVQQRVFGSCCNQPMHVFIFMCIFHTFQVANAASLKYDDASGKQHIEQGMTVVHSAYMELYLFLTRHKIMNWVYAIIFPFVAVIISMIVGSSKKSPVLLVVLLVLTIPLWSPQLGIIVAQAIMISLLFMMTMYFR